MNDDKEVYRQSISEIEAISALFDKSGRCLDIASARQKMADLKANLRERIKRYKGSPVELVLAEALTRIRVKSNSGPNQRWLDDLYSCRIDLEFYLHH